MWKGQRGGGMVYRYQVLKNNKILVQTFPTTPWDRNWKNHAQVKTLKEFQDLFTPYENFLLLDDYPMADFDYDQLPKFPKDFDIQKYIKDNNL
jgi:hypothetical protein